jgi:hypothetical protein
MDFQHHAKNCSTDFCPSNGIFGTDAQQHLKSALHAVNLNSLLAAMLAAVKTPL